jgi:hypothetical protein
MLFIPRENLSRFYGTNLHARNKTDRRVDLMRPREAGEMRVSHELAA